MKKRTLFGAAAIAGASLAVIMHNREKAAPETPAVEPPASPVWGEPVSALLDQQQNLERASAKNLRDWFVDNCEDQTSGKVMIVAEMREPLLAQLGYALDVALDTGHYLFLAIQDKETKAIPSVCVINFREIDPELQTLLNDGGGVFKVTG